MADAVRRIVRNGDKTTAGGTVIAPGTNYTVMGKQIANVHCQVECTACNRTGSIQSVPPMPTYFDYGGIRAAFDGDLCICGCSPHPRLLSSLDNWSASSYEAPIAVTPAAADWLLFAGHKPEEHGLDHTIQFHAVNKKSGKAIAGARYKITLSDGSEHIGETDAAGMTKKIYANSNLNAKIEVPYHGNSSSEFDDHSDSCGC